MSLEKEEIIEEFVKKWSNAKEVDSSVIDEFVKENCLNFEEFEEIEKALKHNIVIRDDSDDDKTAFQSYNEDGYMQYINSIKDFRILSKEETIELINEWRNGNEKAHEMLVNHNQRLVVKIAWKQLKKYDDAEIMDLIQYGNIGLLKAIEKFDISKGAKLSTYATYWISAAISTVLNKETVDTVSSNESIGEDESNLTLEDTLPDEKLNTQKEAEEKIENPLKDLFDKKGLTEKEQIALIDRNAGYNYAEISEKLNITEENAKQLIAKARKKITISTDFEYERNSTTFDDSYGDATRFVYNQLQEEGCVLVDEWKKSVDFFKNENNYSSFSEKLLELIGETDLTPLEALKEKFKSAGIIEAGAKSFDEADRKNISNYLKRESGTKIDRTESIIKICFAFNMTPEQASDFIEKVCYDRAFNFKNYKDIIYYFALKNGISYNEAKKYINALENAGIEEKIANAEKKEELTNLLRDNIQEKNEIAEIIDYILSSPENFTTQRESAKKVFEELFERSNEIAMEFQENVKNFDSILNDKNYKDSKSKKEVIGFGLVLRSIFCFQRIDREIIKKNLKEHSLLEKYAIQNLPNTKAFENMLKDSEYSSDDSVRKSIILLSFYNIYSDDSIYEDITAEDFIEEINSHLTEASLPLMYPRNPYDAMFFMFANTKNPLECFRNFFYQCFNYKDKE